MDLQLQLYYRQSSPAKNYLDHKLQPLLKRIHHTKANSIHQLNLQNQTLKVTNIFSKQKPLKAQMKDPESIQNRQDHPTRYRKRASVTPSLSPHDHSERIILVSPNSKVKKHLIDYIDFQNMETALYKKKQRINLFQHFYQTITQRDKFTKQNARQKMINDQIYSQTLKQDKNKQLSFADNTFRITQRKKFWKQERTESNQKPKSHSLAVRGLAQSRTIDF